MQGQNEFICGFANAEVKLSSQNIEAGKHYL